VPPGRRTQPGPARPPLTALDGSKGVHALQAQGLVCTTAAKTAPSVCQVTLGGESAGGMSVAAHLLSKESGLFHRAIMESVYFSLPFYGQKEALKVGGEPAGPGP
jgi:hypothetical protein